jgi:phenylacetate-CoA ligase
MIFPLWSQRDHPHYRRYRKQFEATQLWSPAELRDLQIKQLRALLIHAHENCPFYRERIDSAGINASRLDNLESFEGFPRLTKHDLQTYGPAMMASGFPESDRVRNQTGGSTGSPLQFYVDKERFDSRMASTHRHDAWAGLRPGDWLAYLWGARLDHVVNGGRWNSLRNELLYRRIELNTSVIRDTDWKTFIEQCRRKKPRFLLAYAQSAVLFARHVRENGIDDIKFDSIITTAEVLLPEQRGVLEETFSAKVFDRYGCREVSVIASECEYHTGLHVNAEALLVEVVPDPSLPDSVGKILITDLLNYSMPLIRYEIGDAATWLSQQSCPCGRGLPMLSRVQGRTTDFLLLPDGRRISGPALTLVVADMSEVRQVQFVQHSPASVTLRVVPGKGYGSHTVSELTRRMGLYLGDTVTLEVKEAESINSEISGKYRFVVNPEASELPARQEVFDEVH